jgi:ATP-binding cassette subfamily F protein 3
MSLISASSLAKSYGAQDVFQDVSVSVPHQSRIALVGPNGVGKTTLLRLLAGSESPDRGLVQRARNLRIGFLPQEARPAELLGSQEGAALWDVGLSAFEGLRRQEAELARLEAEMSDPRRAPQALAHYGPLQEAFEHAGGYLYPTRIRQVMSGLGFAASELARPFDHLSGGERTRAYLARLLLEDPDLLILDEPTNHLDLEAVEWLEGWLRDWPGAALIVSHDRYFLDRTVDTVWELGQSGVEIYHGGYTAYAAQRTERLRFQAAAYQAQQQHIDRERDYIRRNIAGQNTRQAKGRRKRLERMLRDEAIVRPTAGRKVGVRFGPSGRSGDQVLVTKDLAIGYPETGTPLFRVPDLILERGECAALIGPNGAGKTTFLRTLLGNVQPLEGEVRLGASLRVGYFAQAHEGLRAERTVLEELLAAAPAFKPEEARSLLGRFLFHGDSVDKRVDVLSGGERGRLALARLVVEGANFLLLDEPTTHLDIPSQEVLQEALAEFPGTILLVSHDRYLVNALASQVWVIEPEAQELGVYRGGYAEFVDRRERERESQEEASAAPRRRRAAPRAQGAQAKERAVEDVEKRISELEAALADVTRAIEQAGSDVEKVRELGTRYAQLHADLEARLGEWVEQSSGAKPA